MGKKTPRAKGLGDTDPRGGLTMDITDKDLKAALLVAWVRGWGAHSPHKAHTDIETIFNNLKEGSKHEDKKDGQKTID